MKNSYELGQNQFDALLGFFSANRDEAGEKYEQIRQGLVRFFHFKGCHDPQLLADDTINRVALKIDEFDASKSINPVSYFYGFASKILLEYRRTSKKEMSLVETQYRAAEIDAEEEGGDAKDSCLQKCLEQLPAEEKEMIVKYYAREGRAKIELRQNMCELLNCTAAALHTRVFRLKAVLRTCIDDCMKVSS